MKFTFTNKIINELDTGAIELIYCYRWHQMGGRFQTGKMEYFVYLFYDDTGRTIVKQIDQPLATNLDWKKVNQLIETKWRNNELSSGEIEKKKIQKLLVSLGVLNEAPQGLSFNEEYRFQFLPDENEVLEPIFIAPGNPKRESEEKE